MIIQCDLDCGFNSQFENPNCTYYFHIFKDLLYCDNTMNTLFQYNKQSSSHTHETYSSSVVCQCLFVMEM